MRLANSFPSPSKAPNEDHKHAYVPFISSHRFHCKGAPHLVGVCAVAFSLLFPLCISLNAATCHSSSPTIIKVGVSAYEGIEPAYRKYESFLSSLNMMYCDKPVAFQVAIGNYAEVLDWWQRGQIDVGIFAAGPVGRLFESGKDSVQAAYVGSVDDTSFWDRSGIVTTPRIDYHSMAVIHDVGLARGVTSVKDATLKADANHVPLRFLFVRPDSASGYLIPKFFLEHEAVRLEHGAFTYSATNSLDDLRNDSNTSDITVAFLYESAQQSSEWSSTQFRKLKEPFLENISIPVDSILINYNLKESQRDTLKELFDTLKNKPSARKPPLLFFVDPDWTRRFDNIRSALLSSTGAYPRIPLNEIINDLIAASHCTKLQARMHCSVPRLALVLSGGGAKCAYQAGAISAIEETFDRERAQCSPPGSERCTILNAIDINLVAGTSGGSINALLVALEATKSTNGRNDVQKLWEALDQNTLIIFPYRIRAALAVFCVSLLGFVVLTMDRQSSICTRRVIVAFAVVSLLVLCFGFGWRAHPFALSAHMLEHGVMILAAASRDAGFLGISVLVLFSIITCHLASDRKFIRRRTLMRILAVSCVVAFLSTVLIALEWVPALTRSDTISSAIANAVENHLNTSGCSSKRGQDRLDCISSEIASQGAIRRDLVITASRLPSEEGTADEEPDDIYFTAHGHSQDYSAPDPGDSRFVDFEVAPNQGRLLSAIVSSSTIYPVFAARAVSLRTPRASHVKSINLVDGGFIHNSPIEAALKWKADRIILIEASPPDRLVPSKTFLDNVSNAFAFLFSQAQKVDTSSRGQVEIYELRPECTSPDAFGECTNPEDQWSMDLFDFTETRLQTAVGLGRTDVMGSVPRFSRLTGPPQFRDVANLR